MASSEIILQRIWSDANSTGGRLTLSKPNFWIYTLEDEHRCRKVWGKTRIPAGRYRLGFRKFGRFYDAYSRRWATYKERGPFPGVPEILDVPNFTNILIHTGNTHHDTAGCVLVGDDIVRGGDGYELRGSHKAYRELIMRLAPYVRLKDGVWINILNENEQPPLETVNT